MNEQASTIIFVLSQGYLARCGQIIDASQLQAPVQRNKREEAKAAKEGTMPQGWKPHKRAEECRRQVDQKARKNNFGYKLHASVDKRCKLINRITVTHPDMNWNEILNLSAWTPLSEIGSLDIEPIVDGVFRVGVDAYLRTQQYNELLEMGDSRGPFVTMAYWSPSVDGLKRLVLSDPSICVAKPIPAPPPELAMGMTGRYLELAKQASLTGQKCSERAIYSNKGVFLKKILRIGSLGYCFMDRKEKDEQAFAIEISLRK